MGQSKFIVKGIIIIIVLVAAFLAYRFFFLKSDPAPEGLNSLDFSTENGTAATDEFIALINELQNVKLKTELFSNPAYRALKNFSKPLIPEPKGRPNPFLPISAVIGSVSTSTQTSSTTTPLIPRR